ncbi:MAG: hypothetical protein REI78_10760 [Pedobacter sp.]|nr:hypothetical protein [Pedobacter sp.]
MKKLELNVEGLTALSKEEMKGLNGGVDWTGLIKGSGWAYLGVQIVTHWSEIKTGFKAGYNAQI